MPFDLLDLIVKIANENQLQIEGSLTGFLQFWIWHNLSMLQC